MSWFTKWAFNNKAAITFLSVLILLIGVLSYKKLPMEFLPAADQPIVSVIVMGQGTDSKTMEDQVTTPIENAVSGVKGKSHIYSSTSNGFSKIDVYYESGTNMKDAKQEVQESLNKITLPQNVSKPTIVQLNTSMIPIADVAITFEDGLSPNNIDFANKKVIPYFKDIKGVADVQTYGTEKSFVSVKIDNAKLTQNKVSLETVMGIIRGQNSAVSVGEGIINDKTSNIKVVGNLDNIDKVKSLMVADHVKLADIATVEVKKPAHNLTRINGKDGLLLIVTKDSNSNAVSITKDVREATKHLNKKYKNMNSDVMVATSDMVKTSVHAMIKEVLLGALFATIVIMLFLRNVRSTLITIVSIPLSLCLTLFLLAESGITLNVLTLGGVAVAVGRLVDDSIVVIENIFRKTQSEKFSVQMIIDATKEVGSAITASTLTTVAVFLPIGIISTGLKDFMLPFALTITYSLLASLFVALTVVPLLSAFFLKNAKLKAHNPSLRYKKVLTWSLNHKWVIVVVSLLLFVGSIGTYFAMPKGATDNSSSDFVQTTLTYPSDTPVEKVKENTLKLEKYILEQKGIKGVYTQLGSTADAAKYGDVRSSTQAIYLITLDDKKLTDQVVKKINTQKSNYADAELTTMASSLFGGSKTQITIDVVGNNLNDLENTAGEIKNKIKNIDGVKKVTTNEEDKKTVYSLEVDPSKGNAEQLSQQLFVMLNRTPLGTVTIDQQPTDVYLEPILEPKTPEDIKSVPIMTKTGMIPVSSVATLKVEEKSSNLYHKDGDPYLSISAEVKPDKLSKINADLNKVIFGDKKSKGMKIADGVNVYIGGALAQQSQDFSDLYMIMLVSIGLVFLIMIITFKTFRAPIAILCSLPLAAIGAVLGLIISRISVEPTALLGALMLIGIVVTNAIVLLDRVKQKEKQMILREAIIDAAVTRIRPILMTAVATICAMLPLLFKKAETGSLVSQSLAVVVIGGLTVSTLLTLIVIPVIYELLYFRKSRKQRRQQDTSKPVSL
ncbi:multidrug transporter AcrB [Gottfriedia luciferensis]|uniref:Multidrug transporter AcrB n=1 Tax=Gottfriedia luciferensis TaxID=178774 RepID=A0ABX2ZN93_9BACI|nr:efflux RND transporter permease subunit [Gottfriedia luciferensis]ODG89982.1 multidrug transporter AcrB [Gottfriedia luciferensis]